MRVVRLFVKGGKEASGCDSCGSCSCDSKKSIAERAIEVLRAMISTKDSNSPEFAALHAEWEKVKRGA
jgi:hypothetical protein